MARAPRPGSERSTLPPSTTAPAGAETTGGHDFVLEAILKVEQHIGGVNVRLDGIERKQDNLSDDIGKITPQLEYVHGFTTHTEPHLATKADLERLRTELTTEIGKLRTDLTTEIGSRPTSVMLLTIVGLALAVIALPFLPDWWARLHTILSHSG